MSAAFRSWTASIRAKFSVTLAAPTSCPPVPARTTRNISANAGSRKKIDEAARKINLELGMSLTPSTMLALGTAAPDFRLPDTNGKTVCLADFAHAPALAVVFMCNHCPYVKLIREGLAKFGRDYQAKDVAVVGINSNDATGYPA